VIGREKPVAAHKPRGFARASRILKRAVFIRVYEQGRRHFSPVMTFFFLLAPAEVPSAQVGITVGRAIGTAVTRNRIKRRVRDAVRQQLAGLNSALEKRAMMAEIVINPKRTCKDVATERLAQETKKAFAVIAAAQPGPGQQASAAERK
jgi:ribonuclease P protein component